MDVRFLDTLISVIESGSVAEAARRLHLTAAGVSQRIRSLEDEIGVRLVARSGRTVRPTAAAAAILDRARTVQREVRDLKAIAASGTLTGEVRLGVIPSLLCGLIPNILSRFAAAHPQIELRVSRNNSVELYRKLLDGEIDAAVTSHPTFAIPKTCEWAMLREEPFVLVTPGWMPPRHPHAILKSEPFIRLDRQVYAGQLIDNYLRKAGIRPRERLELDGLEAIVVMVDRGLGVAIAPDWAPPWPEGLTLRKLALPDRSFVRRTGLLWMRASLRAGLIDAFLEQARMALDHRPGRKGSVRKKRT
ncbi:LysR family transcriptional regulator [Rhodoplanes sp. Z2-YC6860]|uniref:LysR family transcriptional regulator n=1 Tax=Rhodoplanes sp. Z2-YC6860 TaxID=674703 RepID=UPI00078CB042|nr:LysR family transcriptional regulator [Rhodoplanes sp. Z2-YC6860]AMN40611.1 LysR family transcriptional regulator [Rhodoplanes sp. Z2-YC6860]